MTSWQLLLLFIVAIIFAEVQAMRKQGVAVKGKLMCGKKPAENVKVKIVDIDTGQFFCLQVIVSTNKYLQWKSFFNF